MAPFNPKFYVDNNTDMIYYTDRLYFSGLGGAQSSQLTAGLDQVTTIPGQSSWQILKIHFGFDIYKDIDGTTQNMTYGNSLLGILPTGITGVYASYDTYDEVKDWPFPILGVKEWSIGETPTSPPSNTYNVINDKVSRSGTYRPKSPLFLNRMQEIMFNVNNDIGDDCYGIQYLHIQARRGE